MVHDRFTEQKELFDLLKDKRSKLEYLHDLAKDFDQIAPALRSETSMRSYCSSPFWLEGQVQEGKIHYSISCDAVTPRGLLCLLYVLFEGCELGAVKDFSADLAFEFGAHEFLSPTRLGSFKKMQWDFIDLARQ